MQSNKLKIRGWKKTLFEIYFKTRRGKEFCDRQDTSRYIVILLYNIGNVTSLLISIDMLVSLTEQTESTGGNTSIIDISFP